MVGFSLIIPVYNEERGSLANTISQLLQIPWPENGEIIVVDDGSVEKVEGSEIAVMDRIKIIRHKRNRGYGAALKTGIPNACNECIVITDADGTYPNERIPELVEVL